MKKLSSTLIIALIGLSSLFARDITVSVGAGDSWNKGKAPQLAVWLEDTEGSYVRTLYVTKKAGLKSWVFSPRDGRPESLPVWYHASRQDSGKGTAKNASGAEPAVDAVSSATPKGGVTFTQEISGTSFVIKAEINASFDYNGRWTKKNSGVNGQPSLVYAGEIPAAGSAAGEEIILRLIGTGAVDGSDGQVHADLEGLDSALALVRMISVSFE